MDGWKIVYVSTLPQEIYLAQGFLESEGIPTILKDELTVQVHNFYSNAIGGVKLLVPEAEVARAGELLSDAGYIVVREDHFAQHLETVRTADRCHCPYCGSVEIGKRKEPDWAMLLVYVLLSVLFPIFRSEYHCFDCGRRWRFKGPSRKKSPLS
jgi:DNA-directed RNA polymerase subunit RPC12/RpoP